MRWTELKKNVVKKENKNDIPCICYLCEKDIHPDEPTEYIRTRRRTEIWMHRSCARKEQGR